MVHPDDNPAGRRDNNRAIPIRAGQISRGMNRADPIPPDMNRPDPHRPSDRVARKSSRLAAVFVLASFALPATTPASAASTQALAYFSEAREAFESEAYSKARVFFEQALAAGMEGPAIHYNIGSAAYHGGDLPRAESAFREVARTPEMAPLAYYNLGLIALQRHDEREARDWFERTIHERPPDARLKSLASQRLADLPQPRAAGMWSLYTRGGAGHDDNVALRSGSIDSSATGAADNFGELYVAGSYTNGPWRIDGGGSMLEYAHLDEFSQRAFFLGGARGFRADKWYFELGAYGSQLSLGGDVFEQDAAASVLAARSFYGGSRLRAQLRGTSVTGKGAFTGLTGDRTEFGLYYDKAWRAWYFGAHTRSELNDSEDPIFESRWFQLGAEARYALSPQWGLSAGAALRRTRHPTQSETLSSWDDNRTTLHLGATRSLWRQAQLFVRYEMERNDSPVAGYDYDRNRASASIEWWY